MASLFDQINQRLTVPETATTGAVGASQISAAVQAKSGKAMTTPAPAGQSATLTAAQEAGKGAVTQQSVEGRSQAQAITQQQEAQTQQAAQAQDKLAATRMMEEQRLKSQQMLQQQQMGAGVRESLVKLSAGEQQRVLDINTKAAQMLTQLASERQITMDDLFASMQMSDKELEYRRDAGLAEYQSHLLAMSDAAYMNEITRVAKQRNLYDELEYKKDAEDIRLGESLSRMIDDLGFKTKFYADAREFEKQLAEIDIEAAIKLAEAAIRDEMTMSAFKSAGEAGAAYGTYQAKSNKTSTTDDEFGGEGWT